MTATRLRSRAVPRRNGCRHQPPCPPCWAVDALAARALVRHPEQGWTLLCNGLVVFDDSDQPFLLEPSITRLPRPRSATGRTGR